MSTIYRESTGQLAADVPEHRQVKALYATGPQTGARPEEDNAFTAALRPEGRRFGWLLPDDVAMPPAGKDLLVEAWNCVVTRWAVVPAAGEAPSPEYLELAQRLQVEP